MPAFVHGGPLRRAYFPAGTAEFLIALGSPFGSALFAAFSAPAALWRKGDGTYSLFLNGLAYYNIPRRICQQEFSRSVEYGQTTSTEIGPCPLSDGKCYQRMGGPVDE